MSSSDTKTLTAPLKPDGTLPTRAAQFTIFCVILLVGIKLYGYVVSDSASVLSSLLDSMTDVVLSVMTLFSLKMAYSPPDSNHRQGHGKIEGIIALLQAAFLAGAGVFLLIESVDRFFNPKALKEHDIAILLMWVSLVVSILLTLYQRWVLRRQASLALEADHAHYSTDALITLVVLAVLYAYKFDLAPLWLDPLSALLVAAILIRMAVGIAKKSIDMLMDRELPKAERKKLYDLVAAVEGVEGFHDLRTREVGPRQFISMDIEVLPELSLRAAHDISRKVEAAVLQAYPHADVMIHVDPADDTHDTRHH